MPNDNIPAEASAVHGLTRRMLERAGAPWWPDVHGRLADVLAGASVVLIYNAEFDTRVLHQTAARHGLKLPAFRTRCVMLEYAKYRNVPGHYIMEMRNGTSCWRPRRTKACRRAVHTEHWRMHRLRSGWCGQWRASKMLKKSVRWPISGSWQRTVPGSAVSCPLPVGTREESTAGDLWR